MIKWVKKIFKKKIYLPLWFFMSGGNNTKLNNEDYYNLLSKISLSLLKGKRVVVKINGTPAIIENIGNKISIRKLNSDEYSIK